MSMSMIASNDQFEVKDYALETLQALNKIALDQEISLIEVYRLHVHCCRSKIPVAVKFAENFDRRDLYESLKRD